MIIDLDHVNIRTELFEETLVFYETALALTRGPAVSARSRPGNAWLYAANGCALIHVNQPMADEPTPVAEIGNLDHFAFRCTGLNKCVQRLEELSLAFERVRLEARSITQINVHDPNGIKVELAFVDD